MARTDTVSLELAGYGNGWTDVTADLTSAPLRRSRGFQSAKPDDLVAQPMVFTFELRNDNKNSANTRSYYSPDSVSCRGGFGLDVRVRWQATVNGNTRTRFIGWIEDIAPSEGIFGDQVVKVMALSWLNLAANAGVAGLGQAVNLRGDQLVPLLVALADYPPPATQYATTNDTYPYAFDDLDPATSTVMDGVDSVAKSGFDRFWEKADGTLVLESRSTRQAYAAPTVTFTDTPPDSSHPGMAIVRLPGRRNRSKVVNRVQVTTTPKRVDGSTVVLGSLDVSTNPSFPNGVATSIDLPYVDPNQQAQGVAGVNMQIRDGGGTGSGSMDGTSGNLPLADYAFWSGPGGTGTDVTALVTVSVVYGMNQATLTVTNSSGALAYPSLLQCRGRGIYAYKKVIGTATGAGKGVLLAMDCPYQSSATFGRSAAAYYLAALSVVRTELEQGVQVFAHAGDELTIDQLHQLDISSPVAISETMLGLSVVPYFINSEIEEVDERGNTTLTYGLGLNLSGVAWALGVAGAGELGQATYLQGF